MSKVKLTIYSTYQLKFTRDSDACRRQINRLIYFLLCFSFLINTTPLLSQPDQGIDSLKHAISTVPSGYIKVDLLNRLADKLRKENKYKDSRQYALEALGLAEKIGNYPTGAGKSHYILGYLNLNNDNFSDALNHFRSAHSLLENDGNNTLLINTLNGMALSLFRIGYYTEALEQFKYLLKNQTEKGNKKGMIILLNSIGLCHKETGNYAEAEENFLASLRLAEEQGLEASIADANINIGLIHDIQGNQAIALNHFFQAEKLYRNIGNRVGLATAYRSIGIIYIEQKLYAEALDYLKKSLLLMENDGNKIGMADAHGNLGVLFLRQNQHQKADFHYQNALRLYKEVGNKSGIATCLSNLGIILSNQNRLDEALENHRQAIAIREALGDKKGTGSSSYYLGSIYLDKNNLVEAQKYLENALYISKEIGSMEDISNSYLALYKLDSLKGDYKRALNKQQQYYRIKDSLNQEKINQQIAELKTIYEVEQKESQIALLNEQAQGRETELRLQVANSTLRLNQINLLAKENEIHLLNLSNKERELYEQKLHARNREEIVKDLIDDQRLRELEISRQVIIRNFTLACAVLFSVIIYVWLSRKQKEKDQRLKRKLVMAEINMLHSQMNPHFIFNALNGVHRSIWEKKPDEASEYLTQFSRLTRNVLENSRQQLISLADDLKTLELYILLESQGFEDGLSYTIGWSNDIDPNVVLVPPLLLQPFVENAIKHGLKKLSSNKNLFIYLTRLKDELICEITDNGIGRLEAGKKSNTNKEHTSLGTTISKQRIEVINQLFKCNAHFEVIDLYEHEGKAAGTKVLVHLPYLTEEYAHNHILN